MPYERRRRTDDVISSLQDRISLMMIVSTIIPRCSRSSWTLYFSSTFTLMIVVTLLAIYVPNIKEIFGVIGGFENLSLDGFPCLIPIMFDVKLISSKKKTNKNEIPTK